MKKFFLFAFFALLFAFFAPASFASAVTKTSGDLELTTDDPLFPASIIWFPGLKQTKSFVVKNIGSKMHTLYVKAVNTSQTGNVSDVFLIKISTDGTDYYGSGNQKTMTDFFNEGQIILVDVGGDNLVTVVMAVEMLSSAGNEYQEQEAKFDLEIGFAGEEGAAVVVGGVGGLPGPPVCSANPSQGAPILALTEVGDNSALLAWTSVFPVTHYLLAYGLSNGDYIYGNPDVGNITSFTVRGLSGGATYFFAVRGVNDCAPGSYSNEVIVASRGPLMAGPVVGFVPAVQGAVVTPAGELGEAQATAVGEIAGVEVNRYRWWLVFSLFGFLGLYLYLKRK